MAERDPETNTHQMPYGFNPNSGTTFNIQRNDEWDATHYTFVAPDGMEYRVAKDAVRFVCPRPADVPQQPPVGYAVIFEDNSEWVRSVDGMWHAWDADKIENYDMEANGKLWEDLWKEHGTAHWRALCPVTPEQIPWLMDRDGPVSHLVMPHMDEDGEPTPGLVAWLENESPDIHIRHVTSNVEIVVPGTHFMTMAEMFLRTLWKRTTAARASITVPDDISGLDDTNKE